jgi:hypothetical protein
MEKEWTWLFPRKVSSLMRPSASICTFVGIPRQVSLLRQVLVDAVRATGNLASRLYYNLDLYFKIKQKIKTELFNR